jgi:glycosidase
MREKARFPRGAVHMYFSDNHDEKRAIVRFGEKAALAAAALVFGLDGIPLLYNGQEVGDTTESGAPALFEKMPVFWEVAERRPEFPRFFRQLIKLRCDHPALRRGSLLWLPNSDEDRVLTFRRADAEEEIVFAVNLSNRPAKVLVALTPDADRPFTEITPTTVSAAPAGDPASKLPSLALEPWGVQVFVRPPKD